MLKNYLFSLFLVTAGYGAKVYCMEEKPERPTSLGQSEIFGTRVPSLTFKSLYAVATGDTDIGKANIPTELKERAYLLKNLLSAADSDAKKVVLLNLFEGNYNVFNNESFLQKYFPELMGTTFDKNQELIKILNSVLVKAVDDRDALTGKFALSHGAEPNSIGKQLLNYIKAKDRGYIDFLKEIGLNINMPLIDSEIPLIKVIGVNNKDIVTFLLESGANPNAKQPNSLTPLTAAIAKGNTESAQLLLDNGANIEAPGLGRMTPLVLAASTRRPLVVKFLLDHKAQPNQITPGGITPLMAAIRSGNSDVVRILLDNGADAKLANKFGKLPLDVAKETGSQSIINLINNALQKQHLTNLLGTLQK